MRVDKKEFALCVDFLFLVGDSAICPLEPEVESTMIVASIKFRTHQKNVKMTHVVFCLVWSWKLRGFSDVLTESYFGLWENGSVSTDIKN